MKPSFIKSLADMAPKVTTGFSQSHADALLGRCTGFISNVNPTLNTPPTTVPPTWLTTPYVITRTSKLTAAFGFVGPTLRVSPADTEPLSFPTNTHTATHAPTGAPSYVNIATRNVLLETELFPIMRTTIGSVELFAVPFVSSNIQIKFQPRGEPGPCDSATVGQLCVPPHAPTSFLTFLLHAFSYNFTSEQIFHRPPSCSPQSVPIRPHQIGVFAEHSIVQPIVLPGRL